MKLLASLSEVRTKQYEGDDEDLTNRLEANDMWDIQMFHDGKLELGRQILHFEANTITLC